VRAFQNWLQQHRGISDRTIDRHGRMVIRLLPALGSDPGQYDAHLIRQVILAETKRASIAYVKTMAMALRGYLLFLAASGLCRPGLGPGRANDPAVAFIGAAALHRLRRCGASHHDVRLNHAGRRSRSSRPAPFGAPRIASGDIVALRLDDIEWRQATLSARGKSRRETRLPLPQDAGDAVLDYLRHGRPKSACDRLFLTSTAPFQALSGSTVSSIVRRALDIAAPSEGANLLRHSAATAMLRGGATLDMVGAVLRHRSPDMTAHYAKVDVLMLQQIAQPWPGDA
jgi:integrase